MRSLRTTLLTARVATAVVAASGAPAALAQADDDSAQVILDWNVNALGSIATAGRPPTTTNVLMGMVHGAVHDAVVSIAGGQPYLGLVEADADASKVAAAAAAAHGVLADLFPDQASDLQTKLEASLGTVPDGAQKDAGVAVGEAAAAAMLAAREGDGRGEPNPLTYGDGPGDYRPTPPDMAEFPDAGIANVRMFLADDASYYRTAGSPALDSAQYAAEFDEVKTIGVLDGPLTDEQQALIAFWFGPIPQWAQVERSLTTEMGLDIVDAARLFAIANLAAADTSIGCHADKYHWMFWRPITAIHEAASDGNDATEADPEWTPRAATPPYPDHPSGWNCYSGAHVGAMQQFFGTDEMAYQITNPEIEEPRSYTSFNQGLQDGIELRILQGIHFRSAETQGVELGQKAAALAAERLAPMEDQAATE